MNSSRHVIHERSSIIPINRICTTHMKENITQGEYSLKENVFDPSKSSPPNEFMIKLHMRMAKYNSSHMKDDKRDTE
jgi:hypothetical protein